MIGSIKSPGAGGLLNSLKEIIPENAVPEPTLRDTLAAIVPQSSAQSSSAANLMSNNYTSTESGQSPYVAALLNSFAIDKEMNAKSQKDVIDNVVPDKVKEAAFWYGDRRMRQAKMLKDSIESNAENLDNIKDNIEKKAQEGHSSVVDNTLTNTNDNAQITQSGLNAGGTSKEPSAQSAESSTPLPNLGVESTADTPAPLPPSTTFEKQGTALQTTANPAQTTPSSTSQNAENTSSTPPARPSLNLVV